jgi:high-affinity iron transporter
MFSLPALAKLNLSPLFVQLSDAMAEVKKGEIAQAVPHLQLLQQDFHALSEKESEAGKVVAKSLAQAVENPQLFALEQLAKDLYAFEKEQNPVDYVALRQQFAKRVMPVYQSLNQAVAEKNLSELNALYKRFNTTWTLNEKVVRETSLGHYGQVETAMTFLRIAMLAEPADYAQMAEQAKNLGAALNDFISGNVLEAKSAGGNAPTSLESGIALLEQAYQSLEKNNVSQANADLALFIQQWPIFEGEVSTRDGKLYNRVESELPVIMAKGSAPENLARFQLLIDDLNQLDIAAGYGIVDVMLVLLREGLEALLIILALGTALGAAKQAQAKRWIYGGAGLGVVASLLGAVALQQIFPAATAGTNREILEGAVGVVAVVMMLFVGAWLHSKSSLNGWKKFVDSQMNKALATGSLFSMLSLSFLSVFREGAETILFYAGMLPKTALSDFLLGIIAAIAVLALVAFLLTKTSAKLPIYRLFKVMTWLIYGLGFKILGVSIHSLQLTEMLPRDVVHALPNVPDIGFYATWQGIAAQIAYLLLIPIVARLFKQK